MDGWRDIFVERRLIDPGLDVWGGENMELSFKVSPSVSQILFTIKSLSFLNSFILLIQSDMLLSLGGNFTEILRSLD